MIKTLKDLENTLGYGVDLSFEEYQKLKEPAISIIINDYACKLVEEVKEKGGQLTKAEAIEIAKNEIPATFVPEWMKSLRIGANLAGTELVYLNQIVTELRALNELMQIAFEDKIQAYIVDHAEDFKRLVPKEGEVNDAE